MFLKILQNSQEITCVRVFFFNKVGGLTHRCCPVDFAKFLKTPFFLKHLRLLLLCNHRDISMVQLYRIWMNSKAFLIDFFYWFQNSCYAKQLPFIVTFKLTIRVAIFWISYFSEQLLVITAFFHNSYLQEEPREVFYKKVVLKNFAIFSRNHLQGCNFIKKELQPRCFSVNIAKFLTTTISKNICEWLLLYLMGFSQQPIEHISF